MCFVVTLTVLYSQHTEDIVPLQLLFVTVLEVPIWWHFCYGIMR